MAEPPSIHPLEAAMRTYMKAQRAQNVRNRAAQQLASKATFRESLEEAFNPFSADRKATQFKTLGERANEMIKAQKEELKHKVMTSEELGQAARQKQEQHPELDAEQLLQLRAFFLKEALDAEAILAKMLDTYGDETLADLALEFMIETTTGDVRSSMEEARSLLMSRYGREAIAGRNVDANVQEYAQEGMGNQTELRNLYRDVTGNPREHNELFTELSNQYPFDQLQRVADFLLGSLGSDLKAKGPSISRGELHTLMSEVKALQAILGVYLFFQGRTDLIRMLFEEAGLEVPPGLDFEKLAQEFMSLVEETYPTSMKVYRTAEDLGIQDEAIPQIAVFQQFRDAVRGVAPRIYRSLQHRHDLLTAIIETLEELEEELEEDEDV